LCDHSGATSPDKFKKFIEKDPALERRFQQVGLVPGVVAVKDTYRPCVVKTTGVAQWSTPWVGNAACSPRAAIASVVFMMLRR
jgi:hypothetical protein